MFKTKTLSCIILKYSFNEVKSTFSFKKNILRGEVVVVYIYYYTTNYILRYKNPNLVSTEQSLTNPWGYFAHGTL